MENPKSVAIVAMGASSRNYVNAAAGAGGKLQVADEVWAINAMGGVIFHDRLFMMDDLSLLGTQPGDDVSATGINQWLKTHDKPIYTSKAYPQFPSSIDYPLEDVLNSIKCPYLNTTVAYAFAYAIHLQIPEIRLYGCDFTYADTHLGESGRGNVEYLIGVAQGLGIRIILAPETTLMDVCVPAGKRFYGYAMPPKISQDAAGKFLVQKKCLNF